MSRTEGSMYPPKWTAEDIRKHEERLMLDRRASSHFRRQLRKNTKTHPHSVWLHVPMNEPEVYGRYATRHQAERIAKALERKYAHYTNYGKTEVWVESPGTIEESLRKMHEEYEGD